MTLTIYYPLTSFTVGFLVISMFVYSVLGLIGIGKNSMSMNSCDHLYGYYIVHLGVQGFYILSLITNNCCQKDVFRFLMTFIYYLSFVTIYTTTTSNITCIQQYYNNTINDDYDEMFYSINDINTILFYNMLQWNIIGSSICFNILLLSFIYSQLSEFYNQNKKLNIDNDERLNYPHGLLYK